MDKMTRKIIIAFVIMIIAAIGILGGYYMLSQQDSSSAKEVQTPKTEVGKLKAKDLDTAYPSTPSEVVKLYWRINKCMYNDRMGNQDFKKLLKQLRKLYDEELLSLNGNSWDKMLVNFQTDRETYKKQKKVISIYSVDANQSVKYGTVKGKRCATLDTSTMETVGEKHTRTYEKFVCRQDSSNHWKIVGWKQVKAPSKSK